VAEGIVTGVDGAADGLRAVEWAALEAIRRGVPLTVAHAREYDTVRIPPDERAALDDAAERVVAEAVDAARTAAPSVTVRPWLAAGSATERLLERGEDAHLVVLGPRGRGGFPRLLLGAVADKVLRGARCPVVVVREGGELSGPVAAGIGRESADTVLRFAFEQAAAGHGALTVHHSLDVPVGVLPPFALPGDDAGPPEERVAKMLAPWRERYPSVSVTVSVRVGSPAAHLVEASTRASLVVVAGRHSAGRLGSVTTQVSQHATCPVAVV
jgi:nucleotide-binding universal stress UspA family protein